MNELRELYQEVILDHGRNPRNRHACADCNRDARGNNPLCGDKIEVQARVADGIVEDVSFEGSGCAISMASASLMTETVKGKSEAEIRRLFETFHDVVTGKHEVDDATLMELDRLAVFAGVREYPMRVKCATLAWHTLNAALAGQNRNVSTE